MNRQITMRQLLAILVVAGLVFAPLSRPVMAGTASDASMSAMADDMSMPATSDEMADDMPCCPSKAPAPLDCDKCVFMATLLWNGGISFGGAIAFIFADLIVLPVLNIYRKYYGWKMAAFLFVTFYAAMAGAALIVDLTFDALGLVPTVRNARVVDASITWNYTTWLNITFLILAAVLVWRFFKTGGLAMLRMMNKPAAMGHSH
jgi:uncharacterized membrane protein YraQ (UPF0718 family)